MSNRMMKSVEAIMHYGKEHVEQCEGCELWSASLADEGAIGPNDSHLFDDIEPRTLNGVHHERLCHECIDEQDTPTPSPSETKSFTFEEFKNSKYYTEDEKALEDMGLSKEDATKGAFIYGGLYHIELFKDGTFYLCAGRDTHNSTGQYATPLFKMEFVLFDYLCNMGEIANSQEDRIPEISTFTPETVKGWCYEMERRGITYHYDDAPSDHDALFNSWEITKLKYLMPNLHPAQNKKWDIHEFAIDAQKVATPSPSHTPLQLEALKHLEQLSAKFTDLNVLWRDNGEALEPMLGKAYPFSKNFDELESEVATWAEKAGE